MSGKRAKQLAKETHVQFGLLETKIHFKTMFRSIKKLYSSHQINTKLELIK